MGLKEQEERRTYSNNPRINLLLSKVIEELRRFTEEQAQNLNEMTAIGRALSAQQQPEIVLEMILAQARRFTRADGGTLYLINENGDKLEFHVLHNDTLNVFMGGTSGNPVTLPPVSLFNEDGSRNMANVSAYVANTGEVVNITDVYKAEGFSFEGTRKFDASLKYRSRSMLVIPMKDHEDEVIGVLQLINAKNSETGETIAFSPDTVDMATALASQAAVVMTQQKLIQDLRNLFESFIRAIATAIDRKSRYTGGHIERVAVLTMMIAEKINEVKEGPFAETEFSKDELEELKIAAWMHDTGKITTPEYIVDKSRKLETVFDRMEVVRERWRAIKFAKQLKAMEQKLRYLKSEPDKKKAKEVEHDLNEELKRLENDLEFLQSANSGTEFMADEMLARLDEIAVKSMDFAGERLPYLEENEIYNLSIRKGTLTAEEREVMNNHALNTIKILEQLHWPKKMANVPSIAGAHHEKLDGSGYPYGLKGDEINLQSRIMAVADIFEALSAKDRPYKKPMPLSQATRILKLMVKDGFVDGDVVDLFLDSELCNEYARKYLDPEQVDIDIG